MSKWLLKMAIEIVSFRIKNDGSFHSYVAVYQKVNIPVQAPFFRVNDDSSK
jgi:hypothetical protein